MKNVIVKMMAFALIAFSVLAVSCKRDSGDTPDNMAEVIGRGDLIVITDKGDSNFSVLYCKMADKTFGVVGADPMFDGERFKFSDDGYTYVGDHGVTFSDKPSPVVMPVYAKKGSTLYYVYLELLDYDK